MINMQCERVRERVQRGGVGDRGTLKRGEI